MTLDLKPLSAAASAVGRAKGGRSVKAEGQRKGRAVDLAEAPTGGEGGDAPPQWVEEHDGGITKTAGVGVGAGVGLPGVGLDAEGLDQGHGSRKGNGKGPVMDQGSLEGCEGSGQGQGLGQGQGPGKGKGPSKGQRPSSGAPSAVAAPGKMVKPSRCQKCHTCRHKQLKKQCLRNKVMPPLSP